MLPFGGKGKSNVGLQYSLHCAISFVIARGRHRAAVSALSDDDNTSSLWTVTLSR